MTIKKLIAIISFLAMSHFSYGQQTFPPELKKLDWLLGTWNRTNAKPGQSGIESWVIDPAGKLVGKGITLRGTDTAFVENLSIVSHNGNVYYVADVPGNKAPVQFKFTELTTTAFVCENAENDFPEKIAYHLAADGTIKATISGGGRSVDYLFAKRK